MPPLRHPSGLLRRQLDALICRDPCCRRSPGGQVSRITRRRTSSASPTLLMDQGAACACGLRPSTAAPALGVFLKPRQFLRRGLATPGWRAHLAGCSEVQTGRRDGRAMRKQWWTPPARIPMRTMTSGRRLPALARLERAAPLHNGHRSRAWLLLHRGSGLGQRFHYLR